MPIDLRSVTGKAVDPVQGKSAAPRKGSQGVDGQRREPDSVALTDTAARLKQAEQAMASARVINAELVARVAGELQAGTYEIDAERIAEKIIEMEQRLSTADSG